MTATSKRVYFHVSYNEKNYAKSLGCKWDIQQKLWYMEDIDSNLSTMYKYYRVVAWKCV